MHKNHFRKLGAVALVLLTALLASCGGGGTVATTGGVGTGGTGISTGTVTGFGSVVLDGTAYSSASPVYYAGTDQDEEAQTSSTAVNLGDQLQIRLDAQGHPSKVVIDPELMGPVANLGAGGVEDPLGAEKSAHGNTQRETGHPEGRLSTGHHAEHAPDARGVQVPR